MRNTFARSLLERARKDDSILLITGDLGFGVLNEFQQELPKQFINAGIAEQSMMSMAAGLASRGYRPFVYSIANFPTFRCLEQIRNDVSYMNNPVTIVAVGAGLSYGVHGYTHHAVEDIAIMRAMANMSIYSPSDPAEVNLTLDLALAELTPAYLRLGKGGEPAINQGFLHSKAAINVVKKGDAGVICWTGAIGERAIRGASLLENSNLRPTLVSVPVLSEQSLREILNLSGGEPILTLEEHILPGGFGSWLLEVANSISHQGPIYRMGVKPEILSQIGSQEYLLDLCKLAPEDIASKFREILC